ncbi:TPA: DUF1642 domain-containing protein [Streptococcus suis]
MNKQEAIERIKNIATLNIFDKVAGQQVDMVIKNEVLDIISQIHEPQKVVVPKFVAEWIEEAKEGGCSLCTAFGLVDGDNRKYDWLFNGDKSNQDTFARAWLDGYEIEKERLYTVEIPNPALDNLEFVIVLKRIRGRVCLVNTYDYMGRELSDEYNLTESEIKEDFDWAWQWAVPVEVKE